MGNAQWREGERPREKLLERGVQSLSDAELLAVMLGTGYRDCSVLTLACELLEQFGGLAGLMRVESPRLLACPGVGSAKYAQLQAAMEMARRQALQVVKASDVLSSPGETLRFLQYHLGSHNREVFCCIFLDSQHRVLCCEDLFFGTLDGAAVYPREVAIRALQHRAAAVIFGHNHPSGVAEPSAADRRITERLSAALGLLDIRVLDHVIVGRGREFSFAQEGLL
ncbi:MAG: DNA repair protein RadC [Pseudomonadales bacterium]|nr:DNA repair protein RadC [Halioglobus sp.]MCP5128287.1 DNA repair protein RadC [Pseudomonadales bacterium]